VGNHPTGSSGGARRGRRDTRREGRPFLFTADDRSADRWADRDLVTMGATRPVCAVC